MSSDMITYGGKKHTHTHMRETTKLLNYMSERRSGQLSGDVKRKEARPTEERNN
jgi:hypothetical protein